MVYKHLTPTPTPHTNTHIYTNLLISNHHVAILRNQAHILIQIQQKGVLILQQWACVGPISLVHRPEALLLTPWCRVLPGQLTGLQLVKKSPAFHGTRRFITALTSVRHLSLSWASPIQSTYPHPTYWRSILILSTHLHLGLPSGLFASGFPTKTLEG